MSNTISKHSISKHSISKYYFIVKSTQNTWIPILSPFVTTSPNENSGEFLSSSWYKNAIPDQYECAVIKIITASNNMPRLSALDSTRIMECVSEMNDKESSHIIDLDFVIMHHVMKKQYLLDMHRRLRKLLDNGNSETATTHSTMQTAAGTFGMSFGLKKNERPHMYCPSFTIE